MFIVIGSFILSGCLLFVRIGFGMQFVCRRLARKATSDVTLLKIVIARPCRIQ